MSSLKSWLLMGTTICLIFIGFVIAIKGIQKDLLKESEASENSRQEEIGVLEDKLTEAIEENEKDAIVHEESIVHELIKEAIPKARTETNAIEDNVSYEDISINIEGYPGVVTRPIPLVPFTEASWISDKAKNVIARIEEAVTKKYKKKKERIKNKDPMETRTVVQKMSSRSNKTSSHLIKTPDIPNMWKRELPPKKPKLPVLPELPFPDLEPTPKLEEVFHKELKQRSNDIQLCGRIIGTTTPGRGNAGSWLFRDKCDENDPNPANRPIGKKYKKFKEQVTKEQLAWVTHCCGDDPYMVTPYGRRGIDWRLFEL